MAVCRGAWLLGNHPKYNAAVLMPRKSAKVLNPAGKGQFRSQLLAWFDVNKRDLPWRRDRDPYRVWLSEIMLQQTRVAAVIDHYKLFLRRFSNVRKLAAARESSVLAAWSGLGYYRRARMLHTTAKKIVRELDGNFPVDAEHWRSLPGIGRYTAAAIASIAFGEAVAVVDGNVERVIQRLLGAVFDRQRAWQVAEALLDPNRPGDFNQAMMELGATICVPRQPKCLLCPIRELCSTRGELPVAEKPPRQQKREISYALDCRNGSVLLVRRPNDATLMPGMWELPEIPNSNGATVSCLTLQHSITTTDYTVRVLQMAASDSAHGTWIAKSRLKTLPLTGLARKILRAANVTKPPR